MTNPNSLIFFAAAIRGGRQQQPAYQHILRVLQRYGTVLNQHVADETISDFGETDVTRQDIHNREMEYLRQADVIVAELTTPSLGVGYLIASALQQKKPVIGLYQGLHTHKLSAMIKGDERIIIQLYNHPEELDKILDEHIRT